MRRSDWYGAGAVLLIVLGFVAYCWTPTLGSRDVKQVGELFINLATAVFTALAVVVAAMAFLSAQRDQRETRKVHAEIACTRLFDQLCNAVVAGNDVLGAVGGARSPPVAAGAAIIVVGEQNRLPQQLLDFDDATLARVAEFRPDIAASIRLGAALLRAARQRLLHFERGDFVHVGYNQPEIADWNRLLNEGVARLIDARDQIEGFTGLSWKDSVNASWGGSPQFHRPWIQLR